MNYYKILIIAVTSGLLIYSGINVRYLLYKKKGRECSLMGFLLFWGIALFPILDCEISIQYNVPMGSLYSKVCLITCTVAKNIVVWLETKYQIDNEKELTFYDRKIPWLSMGLIIMIMEMYSNVNWLPECTMYNRAEWVTIVNLAFIWYYYIKNARKRCNEKSKLD